MNLRKLISPLLRISPPPTEREEIIDDLLAKNLIMQEKLQKLREFEKRNARQIQILRARKAREQGAG